MNSDLKMPAPSQCFVHKPDEKRQLEQLYRKSNAGFAEQMYVRRYYDYL